MCWRIFGGKRPVWTLAVGLGLVALWLTAGALLAGEPVPATPTPSVTPTAAPTASQTPAPVVKDAKPDPKFANPPKEDQSDSMKNEPGKTKASPAPSVSPSPSPGK